MSITQYYVAASLDGYIADPDGRLDWLTSFDGAEGVGERYRAFLAGVGAIAMGAATYEFLLREAGSAWPYTGLPTWVFTHRALPGFAGADIRFVASNDVRGEHAAMREAAQSKNVWLVGGGNLAAQFVRHSLLDEIVLSVAPVVLGGGAPLLPWRIPGRLTLHEVTQLGEGLVELRYRCPQRAT